MKNNKISRFLALLLSAALLLTSFSLSAFAEEADTTVEMIAGGVITEFAPAGTECVSTDPSVAWVDENGSLNALKEGEATITIGDQNYTVTVDGYSDGSDIVGSLKILARYNDNMPFYDGHVYLLFTSYQDGVQITVNDLYAGYEIADDYYKDIREDIANGSNHTGNDAEKYFTLDKDMNSVTLDRGEIVTIGMYRDFDLSVVQAALGSIKNSSLWTDLSATAKTEIIRILFNLLNTGSLSTEEAIANIKAICTKENLDYNKLLDGGVDGGVCFNRELYNQKLEWDQYENVAYELDITRNQLNTMAMYLCGNNGNFSILKNSCATVALRTWNAAVGTRNGEATAYRLSTEGNGIFAFVDAPKTVRDSIVDRLPGCYLNNAAGVAEPDAGYQDETGWAYVSAPEKIAPVRYVYADDSVIVDDSKTKLSSLLNAAEAGQPFTYAKDDQPQVDVAVTAEAGENDNTISGIDFTFDGTTVTLDKDHLPGGIWFKVKVDDPAEGEVYCALDKNSKPFVSEYHDGYVSFYTETLPVTYQLAAGSSFSQHTLTTKIEKGEADIETEVYVKDGETKMLLDSLSPVDSGAKVFIKSIFSEEEFNYILTDITLNGESVYDDAHYDAQESAYFVIMPDTASELAVTYQEASVDHNTESDLIQARVGATFDVLDYTAFYIEGQLSDYDKVEWELADNEDGALELVDGQLKAVREGFAIAEIHALCNHRVSTIIRFDIYDDPDDMAAVTYENAPLYILSGENDLEIPYSGYLVKKGTELTVFSAQYETKAISQITANGEAVPFGTPIIADQDTEIKVGFADAEITGMPEVIKLTDQDNTYQLDVKVRYTGEAAQLPVYDPTIRYVSSDDLVEVDENGMITLTGDIPKGGLTAYVTAVAGSSNDNIFEQAKVIVGDHNGDKIVGKLTISARRVAAGQLIPHGAITFTPYKDVDLDVSYFHYYKPNEQYNDLMTDHADHPENYPSDPALCSKNELGLDDRESYFDTYTGGIGSDPQTISLKAGESISMSNYSYDISNFYTLLLTLKNSTISENEETQKLIEQMERYIAGEEYDGIAAFDGLTATLSKLVADMRQTGRVSADGHSYGGLDINREMYNQFRRDDSQLPNNYYTVEITEDELAAMEKYISDPGNNYYSLFVKNCATGSVDIWNAALFDRPELQLNGSYTGVVVEPESLYVEIGLLALRKELDGEGGKDFYPRSVAYNDAVKDAIAKIDALGEVEYTDSFKEKLDAACEAFYALTDVRQAQVYNADKLIEAENAYAAMQLAADKEAFAAYKEAQKAFADTLAQDGDLKSKAFVANAKAVIDRLAYDESASLEENKALVDAAVRILQSALQKHEEAAVILGDANSDGEITIIDATCIQRHLASIPTSAYNEAAADTDGDGKVTIIDAAYIQRWLVDLPSDERIGKPIG